MTVFSVCMCACAHRCMRVSVSQCVGCSTLSVDLCLVLRQSERMRAAFLILPNTGMGFSLEANPDTLWFVVDRCGWWLRQSEVMRAAFLILPNTGMGYTYSLEANPDTLWFVVDRCGWWLRRSDVRCPAHRDAASRVPGKTETATQLQGLLLGIDSYSLCNVCLAGSHSQSSSNIIYKVTCWKREKGNSLLFSLYKPITCNACICSVWVCVTERERECVCVCGTERERVCVRQRERETESVCVCDRERESVCVSVCETERVCVCVWHRESVCV